MHSRIKCLLSVYGKAMLLGPLSIDTLLALKLSDWDECRQVNAWAQACHEMSSPACCSQAEIHSGSNQHVFIISRREMMTAAALAVLDGVTGLMALLLDGVTGLISVPGGQVGRTADSWPWVGRLAHNTEQTLPGLLSKKKTRGATEKPIFA